MNTDAERLAKNLNIKAGMISLGETIAWNSDAAIMDEAAALIRKLAAENEALKADAARYRWLRNEARTVDWSCHIQVKAQPKMVAYQPNCRGDGQQMDAAIDEAIKQGEKQ